MSQEQCEICLFHQASLTVAHQLTSSEKMAFDGAIRSFTLLQMCWFTSTDSFRFLYIYIYVQYNPLDSLLHV